MNYQHSYHAGNFADVFKHMVLTLIIEALAKKEKPFCYIDTHAGAGCYDLQAPESQKTQEYLAGIIPVLNAKNIPVLIQPCLSIVRKLNPENTLHYYPGSPLIVNPLLRAQDRMILCELMPEVFAQLKQQFKRNSQAAMHLADGYNALKSLLPPQERRGVVLIDPPFENQQEFEYLILGLKQAWQRWPNGIYAVWFPLSQRAAVAEFYQQLKASSIKPILLTEFRIYPDDVPLGLSGCGMIIINPPWHLAEQLQTIMPWLWQTLAITKQGDFKIEWLVAE